MRPIPKSTMRPLSCVLTITATVVFIISIILISIINFIDVHRQSQVYEQNYQILKSGCDRHNVLKDTQPTQPDLLSHYDSISTHPISDPNPDTPFPRIAWLLSFPNSGTSYTMRLVSRATNRSVASNYGAECEIDLNTGTNRPLIPQKKEKDIHDGPFIVHFTDRQLPNRYVLTKTHCGSRCTGCSPSNYIETKESFFAMCSKGSRIYGKINTTTGQRIQQQSHKIETVYDPYLVQRVIHLIRNPWDNIVSNFHLEHNEKKKQRKDDWIHRFPNNIQGFKKYCQDLDSKHTLEESDIRFLPSTIVDLFQNVPCHAAFFIFIQWHNLALQVEQQLKLPSLFIYYDDYSQNFNQTIQRIFHFLDVVPNMNNIPPFIRGKNYTAYYTEREWNASRVLMTRLADPSTFELLRRYLEY